MGWGFAGMVNSLEIADIPKTVVVNNEGSMYNSSLIFFNGSCVQNPPGAWVLWARTMEAPTPEQLSTELRRPTWRLQRRSGYRPSSAYRPGPGPHKLVTGLNLSRFISRMVRITVHHTSPQEEHQI